MHLQLAPQKESGLLPPILAGRATPAMRERVQHFFFSVASLFEAWVTRRQSLHTQRAYREDVMSFVRFQAIAWPHEATALFSISVRDVLAFREQLVEKNTAPKTINRRILSVSSFYKYLAAAAAELRLPITVPNPAHAQFISREKTRALSATRARQLIGLPDGESVINYRDRAILKTFLYSGIRLGTACRLKVSDFHQDGDEVTLRLHEKGDKRRTIGIHFTAAQAISEYITQAGLTSGPLFRPLEASALYLLGQHYLEQLPGAP